MEKRILKRHKRQVARAKKRVKRWEPDVRTPEQVRAAREAIRPFSSRRNDPFPHYPKSSIAKRDGLAAAVTTKADVES